MELGNAFTEINDADEQLRPLRGPVASTSRASAAIPDYVEALSYGMPPTAASAWGSTA